MSLLVDFLKGVQTTLHQGKFQRIIAVLGNEAADLDSIVSSVTFAYHLTLQQKNYAQLFEPNDHEQRSDNDSLKNSGIPIVTDNLADKDVDFTKNLFVPIVSIPRADLELRTECTFTMDHCFGPHVLQKQLIFWDEINLRQYQNIDRNTDDGKKELKVILTDHNKLGPSFSWLDRHVVGILDHHKDELLYQDQCVIRDIAPVGSATTLVVEDIKKHDSQHDGHDETKVPHYPTFTHMGKTKEYYDGPLLKFLISPILVDTLNLGAVNHSRVTDRDIAMGNYLIQRLTATSTIVGSISSSTSESSQEKEMSTSEENERESMSNNLLANLKRQFNQTEFFDAIQEAKFNISHLSSYDLLRKDYKEWSLSDKQVGISSVGLGLETWMSRDGTSSFVGSLNKYMTNKNLDLLMVMTAYEHQNKGFQRELVIHFSKFARAEKDAILEKLVESQLELSLKEVIDDVIVYQQGNVKASRKVVQPVIQTIMTELN